MLWSGITHHIPSEKPTQIPSLPANPYGGHSLSTPPHTPCLEYGRDPPGIHHTPQLSGHSVLPTPGYPSYHHDVFTAVPAPDPLQLVLEQLQKMDTRISAIESSNKSILKAQEEISDWMQKNEETSQQVQTALVSLSEKPVKSGKSKNISNQHPKLKVTCTYPFFHTQPQANLTLQGTIHPMFFNLCGVDRSIGSSECIEVLASHAPHPHGEPFIMDGEKPVWHPVWGEKID